MPVQIIGIIVLVVIVIVAVAVFFFAGLSEQGAVMGSTADQTVGGLETKLDLGLSCLPPYTCCSATVTTNCCSDCGACPGAPGC